jgi:hypothetical protein
MEAVGSSLILVGKHTYATLPPGILLNLSSNIWKSHDEYHHFITLALIVQYNSNLSLTT